MNRKQSNLPIVRDKLVWDYFLIFWCEHENMRSTQTIQMNLFLTTSYETNCMQVIEYVSLNVDDEDEDGELTNK